VPEVLEYLDVGMMQAITDKCAAIISLLGLVWLHLDRIPGALKTPNQQWVSERSPLDDPPKPPAMYNIDCKGRCGNCWIAYEAAGVKPQCPPEEAWVSLREGLRRQYRIGDVEAALMDLATEDVAKAQAVWSVYVEPWPDPRTEPIAPDTKRERARLAGIGVMDMAEAIEGDVRAYGEKVDPRDNQIRQLASQGFTRKRIARELRCSLRDVQSVLLPRASTGGG
jgi:hypothetical protein